MHKKLMAVAVAGALAAPGVALAQTSTVQIGGSITVFYYSHDHNNPAAGKTGDILETSEPEIFIRGEEKLGGDLSAWFQCTSSLDGIVAGASAIANSGWCARNSGIGFKGSWGNIFAGNWDTPHKLVFNRIRGAFGGTNPMTGGSATILEGGAASGTQNPMQTITASARAGTTIAAATAAGATVGTVSVANAVGSATAMTNNPASFFRRQASSWTYHSPVWSGFQLQGAFSAANETTGIPSANPLKPRLWSVAAHYDNGPLYLGAAYERHNDYNPGNATVNIGQTACAGAGAASCYSGGSDDGWLLGAGYTFAGKFKLTGLYSRNNYETAGGGEMRIRGWAIFADWAVAGPHIIRAGYGSVSDSSGTSMQNVAVYKAPLASTCGITSAMSCAGDTGAKWWNVHYEYRFSKRTGVLVNYNRIDNDSNGAISLGKTAAIAGGDQSAMGIGIKHRF
jgi:predicted porin